MHIFVYVHYNLGNENGGNLNIFLGKKYGVYAKFFFVPQTYNIPCIYGLPGQRYRDR